MFKYSYYRVNDASNTVFNVDEFENQANIQIDLPGVKKENVKVTYEDHIVTVQSTRAGKTLTRTCLVNRIYDLNTLQAKLEDGVLHLTVQKRPEKTLKEVQVC